MTAETPSLAKLLKAAKAFRRTRLAAQKAGQGAQGPEEQAMLGRRLKAHETATLAFMAAGFDWAQGDETP